MSKVIVRGMNCPVARTLDLLGEKWTLLILRDLFLDGPRKYQDLFESLEGISPNILSDRIKKLIDNGLLSKELYSEHPPRYEYRLTKKGKSLEPILMELKNWGKVHTRFIA